jgi:hypothetical protein
MAAVAAGWVLARPFQSQAQTVSAARPNQLTVVKLSAFPMMASGYHAEVEKGFQSYPRHSLGLTLQVYNGRAFDVNASNTKRNNEHVNGYGAELLHRVYLLPQQNRQLRGLYAGYGPGLQRFDLSFKQLTWRLVPDGFGSTFYELAEFSYTETITRYGASAVLGFQDLLEGTPVILDLYAGLGYRQSSFRSALPESRYRGGLLDYGHKGVYIPAGLKIGLLF